MATRWTEVGRRATRRFRRRRTGFVGQRERLAGTPGRAQLIALTTLVALLAAAVIVLALPGPPADAGSGLVEELEDPRVLGPMSAVVLVLMAACLRAWTYRHLLQLPGPVQILPLEHAPAQRDDPTADGERVRLDMHFRDRLSEANLSAFAADPSSKGATDFVALLETADMDANQPFAMVGRLLRIVRPTHAYEVRATTVRRQQAPTCGVVAEMVVLPRRRTTFSTYWAETWEEALDAAATGVTVQVVPRSQHSHRGVWASWKGFALDEDLVNAYNRARRLQRERRYEEALEELFKTVRADPGNGYLKFAVGSLQEKLGLYVDALMTHRSIWQMEERRRRGGHRGRASRRIGLFARYRYTRLLGVGETLAEQWLAPPPGAAFSRRYEELRVMRSRLKPVLVELFSELDVTPEDLDRLGLRAGVVEDIEVLLDERPHVDRQQDEGRELSEEERRRLRQENRRLRERRLHLFFQLLAEGSVADLLGQHSARSIARLDVQLTKLSHELLRSWAGLRTQRARHLLDLEHRRQAFRREARGLPSGRARKRPRQPVASEWPLSLAQVEVLWEAPSPWRRHLLRRLESSREFTDHYMAACIYAIGLLPGHDAEIDEDERAAHAARASALTAASVASLRRAAEVGGSSAVAARWRSIIADEADLAGLRGTDEFRRFTSEWLPSHDPEPIRPKALVRLNASRNSVRLCRLCADRISDVWRARASLTAPTTIREALRWLREEELAWQRAAELAIHHRHWQTRLRVIREMQRLCRRHGVTPFSAAHPRFTDHPIDGVAEAVDKSARHEIHFGDLRLAALADALTRHRRLPGFREWEEHLRRLQESGESFDGDVRRRLAADRAATWRALEHAFRGRATTDVSPREDFEAEFAMLVARLGHVWATASPRP